MTDALSPNRLHVAFCDSGAGALRHWGASTGNSLQHFLPFAPLASPVGPLSLLFQAKQRLEWAKTHAPGLVEMISGDTDDSEAEGYLPIPRATVGMVRQHSEIWRERATIWYCSRNSGEVSLLSAFLQIGPQFENAMYIDVAPFAPHVSALGSCRSEDFGQMGALARRLATAEIHKLRNISGNASESDAVVRVFEGSELIEKPSDFLDDEIINFLECDFQKLAPLFSHFWNRHNGDGWHRLDYFFLLWRFRELARLGRIEWRGFGSADLFDDNPTRGEVRRLG